MLMLDLEKIVQGLKEHLASPERNRLNLAELFPLFSPSKGINLIFMIEIPQ